MFAKGRKWFVCMHNECFFKILFHLNSFIEENFGSHLRAIIITMDDIDSDFPMFLIDSNSNFDLALSEP